MDEKEMELEISRLIDLVVAERLVRKSPYAHESPIHKERIRRLSSAHQALSSESRRRIVLRMGRRRRE